MTAIRFDIRDFRRLERATLSVEGVTFVGGRNGHGKTSLAQAIGALLTGSRIPPGLPLKLSEAGALVRSGAADAGLSLKTDGGGTASLSYPKAEYKTKGDALHASSYAAGQVSILDLPDKERAVELARYLKSEPSLLDLIEAIREAGLVSDLSVSNPTTEETAAMDGLRLGPGDLCLYRYARMVWTDIEANGWDAALKRAREFGARQKGAWETVTGEKAYQPTGADTWRPRSPDWSDDLLSVSQETLEAEAADRLRLLEEAIGKGAVDKAEIDRLQSVVNRGAPPPLQDAADAEAMITDARRKLDELPRPSGAAIMVTCPHCGAESRLVVGSGAGGAATYALDADGGEPLSEEESRGRESMIDIARVNLRRAEGALADILRNNAATETALRDFLKAEARLAELRALPDNGPAIEAARTALAAARARLDLRKRKEDADKIHRAIQDNQALVAILAPEGLRRRKLAEVVSAFNDGILAPLCETAGWEPATLDEDLTFRYGGFPAGLLAESHLFRLRAVLQFACARVDDSAMVVVDGADVLDRQGRIGLLKLAMAAGIPTLILATYDTPEKLPALYKVPGGATYWLEHGRLRPVADAVPAAAPTAQPQAAE
jgi:hypothetical protein